MLTASGPLRGCKVVELAGLGPAPFCGLVLSDLGADVVRIDRVDAVRTEPSAGPNANVLDRGRRSVAVDLNSEQGVALVLDLVAGADALIEGFRPGVAERLGLGPDRCLPHLHPPRRHRPPEPGAAVLGHAGCHRRPAVPARRPHVGGPRRVGHRHRAGQGAARGRHRGRLGRRRQLTETA